MKTLAKLVMMLVVVALSVPAYGEILIYRFSEKSTRFEYEAGEWKVEKEKNKGYIVLNVDYTTGTIIETRAIPYWKDKKDKWYHYERPNLELVIVDAKRKNWVILEEIAQPDELLIVMLAGTVKKTNIGTGQNQEVAKSLRGYILEDDIAPDRELKMSTLSLKLDSKRTKWSNDPAGTNQDFNKSAMEILTYLIFKGYVLEP